MTHHNAPLTPEGRRRLCERIEALAAFLNEYNHERPHSSIGNKPPSSRVPVRTYRIQPQPKVLEVPLVEGMGHEPDLFDLL